MARGPRRKAAERADAAAAAAESAGTEAQAPETRAPRKKLQRIRNSEAEAGEDDSDGPLTASQGTKNIEAWVDNTAKLERWLESRGSGLEGHLTEGQGAIVRLRDFLPVNIADSVLAVLENLPEDAWELSEQGGDEGAARHRFWSADICDISALAPLRSVFWRMLPKYKGEPTLPIFSCARYGAADNIGEHDDRAHVPFFGGGELYSRTVAIIWYLTRGWSADNGGSLMDLEAPAGETSAMLVPIYNSLVAFDVPHKHAVQAVKADRYRYSIFGWYHQKGERYELPGQVGKSRPGKRRKQSTETGDSAPSADAKPRPKKKKKASTLAKDAADKQ